MIAILKELKKRNDIQYFNVVFSIIGAILCALLILVTSTQVNNINAWIKPLKFFISGGIFCGTMGWYCYYLSNQNSVKVYSWMTLIVLFFENIYISIQAGRGQLSHFNISSVFNGVMFSIMGLAISTLTLWTLFMGFLFFKNLRFPISQFYLWSIRIGILFFVIFAFEGGIMASNLKHTVGGADTEPGLLLFNWSIKYGDLRVAHFFGMHSLQLIPLAAYYFFKSNLKIILFSIFYFVCCSFLYLQAMNSQSFIAY